MAHFEQKKRRFEHFSSQSYRLLAVILLAAGVMLVDVRYPEKIEPVRHYALQLFEPVLRLLSYPQRIYQAIDEALSSQQQLVQENKLLKSLLLQKAVQLQQLSELKAENMRLRALVDSGVSLSDDFIYAQVLSASPQPQRHVIMLNKGLREGIKVGYPVLDAFGVMGQVIESTHRLSQVMLISDSRHALPVRIRRTQQGAILKGTGDTQRLKLEYAAETMDVKEGDILETSGAGLYFPAGYPVAKVSDINKRTGKAFAQVTTQPLAHLESSQHVIVLFKQAALPPIKIEMLPTIPNQDSAK